MKKSSVLKNLGRFLYFKRNRIYDYFTSKVVKCSIGDLMLLRDEMYENQFLVASRVCDIKKFVCDKSDVFPFQTEISSMKYGLGNYNASFYNDRFKNLIISYKENGYKDDFPLMVDKMFRLADGNHRLACNYFFGIEEIRVEFTQRIIPYKVGIDSFLNSGLSESFLKTVVAAYERIQKELISRGDCFCCLTSDLFIIDLLAYSVKILKNVVVVLKEEIVLPDKTNVHPGRLFLTLFSLSSPNYCQKDGCLYSERVVEIRRILDKKINFDKKCDKVLFLSNNCLEGYKLYNQIKKYIRENG